MSEAPYFKEQFPYLKELQTLDLVEKGLDKPQDYDFPMVSVIMPIYNCAQMLVQTVESVLQQDYPSFELIVIDAGSTDRSIEVLKGFQSEKIQIFSVSSYQRYEMINKGISQATGDYVCCIFPGDFYISIYAFKIIMKTSLEHERPHFIYCGTVSRMNREDPVIIFNPFTISNLKRGVMPTGLNSCWFRRDLFTIIGKFNTSYVQRSGFEFFCRVINQKSLRTVALKRIFTDSEVRVQTKKQVLNQFREVARTISKQFGIVSLFRWLFIQSDIKRFFHMWLKSMKTALIGR